MDRSSRLVPDHLPRHFKKKFFLKIYLFHTLRCIPGERMAAREVMICLWWMHLGSRIKSGQGAGEVGLSCGGGGGHSPDCQTASLQPQLPRIQRLARSQGQHDRARSGPFTVDWSHTRSSPTQASSGTRQNSLCNRPEDEAMAISSKSLLLGDMIQEKYLNFFFSYLCNGLK